MNLAFAATMIRPRYLLDSIVAQWVSVSTFSHSLDPKPKFALSMAAMDWAASSSTPMWRSRPVMAPVSPTGAPAARAPKIANVG